MNDRPQLHLIPNEYLCHTPLPPTTQCHKSISDVFPIWARLREGHGYLQRKLLKVIRHVIAEPWHLPFSDINPAHFGGCIFTLESGQCSSRLPLYNCERSFKCKAQNVSLKASGAGPWRTVGAEKTHLFVFWGHRDRKVDPSYNEKSTSEQP